MNKVIMMGRLTKDPEVRYSGQTAIAGFGIAVDRKYAKEEPKADFFDCTAFGKLGEFVQKYLAKGTKIVLSGRVENNNYTDKNGQKVYGTRIVAEEIDFAESKQAQHQAQEGYSQIQTGYPQAPQGYAPQGYQAAPQGYQQPVTQAVPLQGYQPAPYAAQQYTPQAVAPVSPQGFVSSQPEYMPQEQYQQQTVSDWMNVPDEVDDLQLPFN